MLWHVGQPTTMLDGVLQRRNERAQENMLRILARREMSRSHGRGSIPKWLHAWRSNFWKDE